MLQRLRCTLRGKQQHRTLVGAYIGFHAPLAAPCMGDIHSLLEGLRPISQGVEIICKQQRHQAPVDAIV
jgi:hypothetical protein